MSDANESPGTIVRREGGSESRLERVLDHDQATVWAMLTEPARFADWLAPGSIDLQPGGAAKLNFVDSGTVIDSSITAFDPPRLLEYSWSSPGEPARPVRWETEILPGGGTRLVLTLWTPEGEDVAKSCAGWEAHLMMLLAAIEGVPIKFPFRRFQEARAAYTEMLAAGA